ALAALAPTSAELRVRSRVASSSTLRRRTTCSLYSLSRLSISSRRTRRLAMSARILSPSFVLTPQAPAPSASADQLAAASARPSRLAPGEVDTAVLGPARLIGSLRVQRPTRQDGHERPIHAQAAEVVAHGLRALL